MGIEEDLRKRLRHFGLEKIYDASVVCDGANKVSKGRYKAVSFKNGVLKLAVISAAKAHKLKFEKQSIIDEVQKLTNARINRLIFTLCEEDPCNKN